MSRNDHHATVIHSRGTPEPNTDFHGPEANLHKHISCRKHPEHKDFIPVEQFNIGHLPEQYREEWRVDFIKAVSELTVHLKVSTISKKRPEHYPRSFDDYPFHIPGGGIKPRSGSGWVRGVTTCGEGSEQMFKVHCDCVECEISESPRTSWWELSVVSASHVVFDTTEAKDTTVTLFDDDDTVSDKVVLKGHEMHHANIDGDRCDFTVITHDESVAGRLKKAIEFLEKEGDSHEIDFCQKPLLFAVSHPHGCSKQITLGECVENYGPGEFRPRVRHTASTCPGSSGGPVVRDCLGAGYWLNTHPHSEAMPDGNNRSGYSWVL